MWTQRLGRHLPCRHPVLLRDREMHLDPCHGTRSGARLVRGPWCSWINLCDPGRVEQKRSEHLPLWRVRGKFGTNNTSRAFCADGAALVDVGSSQPDLHEVATSLPSSTAGPMSFWPQGSSQRNGMPHPKRTALDANDPAFANCLRMGRFFNARARGRAPGDRGKGPIWW